MNRYAIELGVDDPATGYRECVGETGPFLTKLGAERAMRQTFGKRANLAARFSEYGENSHLAHLPVVYWAPNEDGSQALIISEDPHDCGWPERITYVNRESLEIIRSGCAGCEAERPVERSHNIGKES